MNDLQVVNATSGTSDGHFLDPTTVIAEDWDDLAGTLTNGRIEWANGDIWYRDGFFRLEGWYEFNSGQPKVGQEGGELLFENENGDKSDGGFIDDDVVVATDWGNLIGDIVGGEIQWRNNSDWTRDLSGDWTYNGTPEVEQSGTTLTFIHQPKRRRNPVSIRILMLPHRPQRTWSITFELQTGQPVSVRTQNQPPMCGSKPAIEGAVFVGFFRHHRCRMRPAWRTDFRWQQFIP